MNRILAPVLAVALSLTQFVSLNAQVQAVGVIAGSASGPIGPLSGITIQIVDSEGRVVRSTVTSKTGTFRIDGLNPGTFTAQAVGSAGAVIAAASATLSASAMTATVTLSATSAAVAGIAAGVAGVGPGVVAAAGGLSAATVAMGVGAAAAAVGAAAVVSRRSDASPSR
jgi:hypothetical protein